MRRCTPAPITSASTVPDPMRITASRTEPIAWLRNQSAELAMRSSLVVSAWSKEMHSSSSCM